MASWDIELAGQGYMLAPGSYRSTLGKPTTRHSRGVVQVEDFAGGLTAGALLLASQGVWPASWPDGSRSLGPAPVRQAADGTLSTARPVLSVISGDYVYIAVGDELYRWDGGSTVTSRWTMPAPATALAVSGGMIFASFGLAADVARWDDAASAASLSVLGVGYRALTIGAVGEMLVSVLASTPAQIEVWSQDLSSSVTHGLDSACRMMAGGGDRLLIATNAAIYAIAGAQFTTHRLEAFGSLSQTAGLEWLTIHRGSLVGWIGGQVMRYEPGPDRWSPLGLSGESSSGAAEAAGWLVVGVQLAGATGEELWAFDDEGWWRLHESGSFPTAGPDGQLAAFVDGDDSLVFHDLIPSGDAGESRDACTIVTDPLPIDHAGSSRDWLQVGVELSRGDGLPIGDWSANLEYSTDGGVTWSLVTAASVEGPLFRLTGDVDIAAEAIHLRVSLAGTSGLPPYVQSIWASWEQTTERPASRRWSFDILASDRLVDRDGVLDTRDGQAIRTAIWSAREADLPVAFHDVDDSVAPVERYVKIIELTETWPRPFDQPSLGAQTRLSLTIEEV